MGDLLFFPRRGEKVMSVLNIAKAFLSISEMSPKKLQKLCYYAQGWHLALYDEELFSEDFQAWIHGPVVPSLYHEYKDYGWKDIPQITGETIHEDYLAFAHEVYNTYGHLSGDQLEKLSHSEEPWKVAREDKKPWESHDGEISKESMKVYFRKIYEQAQK